LGLGLAFVATRGLIAFVAQGASYTTLSARPDGMVLLFTPGVSVATGMLFGLAPAVSAARGGAAGHLSSNTRTAESGGGRGSRMWPKALVTAQVVLSLLLLVGAGLFLRTLENLQTQNYGFERSHVLLATFDARLAGYKPTNVSALYGRMLERLEGLPGVQSVAISTSPPISQSARDSGLSIPGYTQAPKEDMSTTLNFTTGRYFETVGIRMAAGRAISADDVASSQKVVVINQAIARHYFPKGDAVGRSLNIEDSGEPGLWQIVGVAEDTKANDPRNTEIARVIYVPLAQLPVTTKEADGEHGNEDLYAGSLELRTAGDPAKTIRELRAAMAAVDPNVPLLRVLTIQEQVDGMIKDEALISRLTGIFSLLAVLLAGIGLYGVMSYNVIRRTPEIGIRLALGAQTASVRWMVLRESLGLLGIGIGLGLPLTVAATILIRKQLFGLSAVDPATFLVAITVVTGMTLLAGWLPARRATRVDPMVALRCD